MMTVGVQFGEMAAQALSSEAALALALVPVAITVACAPVVVWTVRALAKACPEREVAVRFFVINVTLGVARRSAQEQPVASLSAKQDEKPEFGASGHGG